MQLLERTQENSRLSSFAKATAIRDGLMIALLAVRPLRLKNFTGLRIGVHLLASPDGYLLIVALERAGLTFADIEPAYLTPADARAALESGSVQAWVTWDPFLAAVQQQANARILLDGSGLADYQRYYLAASPFAEARPDVIAFVFVFGELQKTGQWVKQNPAEAAALLAPIWGLDQATVTRANERRSYAVRLVEPASLGEQQKIADTFLAAKLLPKRINAADVVICEAFRTPA